jgi:hypothetical protein
VDAAPDLPPDPEEAMTPPRNPWLCVSIVLLLGTPLLALCASAVLHGGDLPAALVDLSKFTAGALASFLVMIPRGQIGGGQGHDPGPPPPK